MENRVKVEAGGGGIPAHSRLIQTSSALSGCAGRGASYDAVPLAEFGGCAVVLRIAANSSKPCGRPMRVGIWISTGSITQLSQFIVDHRGDGR